MRAVKEEGIRVTTRWAVVMRRAFGVLWIGVGLVYVCIGGSVALWRAAAGEPWRQSVPAGGFSFGFLLFVVLLTGWVLWDDAKRAASDPSFPLTVGVRFLRRRVRWWTLFGRKWEGEVLSHRFREDADGPVLEADIRVAGTTRLMRLNSRNVGPEAVRRVAAYLRQTESTPAAPAAER